MSGLHDFSIRNVQIWPRRTNEKYCEMSASVLGTGSQNIQEIGIAGEKI